MWRQSCGLPDLALHLHLITHTDHTMQEHQGCNVTLWTAQQGSSVPSSSQARRLERHGTTAQQTVFQHQPYRCLLRIALPMSNPRVDPQDGSKMQLEVPLKDLPGLQGRRLVYKTTPPYRSGPSGEHLPWRSCDAAKCCDRSACFCRAMRRR